MQVWAGFSFFVDTRRPRPANMHSMTRSPGTLNSSPAKEEVCRTDDGIGVGRAFEYGVLFYKIRKVVFRICLTGCLFGFLRCLIFFLNTEINQMISEFK
jgi:hypothetical protein